MGTRKGSKKKDKNGHLSSTTGLKLIQHKHCVICGKAQLMEDPEYCSDDCKKVLDDNAKRKKMWWIYIFIAMIALVLFFVVPYLI
jgi:predicted nucleic acid-binding Zn ribbon protein